jgi:hypothetical protein
MSTQPMLPPISDATVSQVSMSYTTGFIVKGEVDVHEEIPTRVNV